MFGNPGTVAAMCVARIGGGMESGAVCADDRPEEILVKFIVDVLTSGGMANGERVEYSKLF